MYSHAYARASVLDTTAAVAAIPAGRTRAGAMRPLRLDVMEGTRLWGAPMLSVRAISHLGDGCAALWRLLCGDLRGPGLQPQSCNASRWAGAAPPWSRPQGGRGSKLGTRLRADRGRRAGRSRAVPTARRRCRASVHARAKDMAHLRSTVRGWTLWPQPAQARMRPAVVGQARLKLGRNPSNIEPSLSR